MLSKIVLVNLVAFAVLKILHRFFIKLSEIANSFLKIRLVCLVLVLDKKRSYFHKNRSLLKISRRKNELTCGTFHTNKCYKLAIIVSMPISLFSKYKFVVHFSNITCTKIRPCISLLPI